MQKQLLRLALRLLKRGALRKVLRGAKKDEGSISVESMLMLPLLVWVFLGTYVFYDAYRAQFVNSKASFTIGDILSRETGYVTPEYLDSLHDLQRFLVFRQDPIRLRVSVVEYDDSNQSHSLVWSEARGEASPIDGDSLNEILPHIPIMQDGEKVLVVQTSMEYQPIYAAGIDTLQFDDFVVTRPRFAGQICWNTANVNPTTQTATC